MRLFIAIPLRPDLAAQLLQAHQQYGDEAVGRWIPQHQLHLTLAFLGEQHSAEPVIEIMKRLESECCFNIDFDANSLAAFTPKILAFEPLSCDPLMGLRQQLTALLTASGLIAECNDGRAFRPHITLLRGRAGDLPLPDEYLDGFSLGVSQLVLYRSEHVNLPDGGCHINYEPLHFSYLSV
ncbi:RNA 2',3'-cyclic phosphodiesterase [Sinobacterium norvegicum]|uniref:RNA 2',3'-cyclic phosphodiesterase n=1 Tax=Sinobacterium norvegicum TaxID=1641715 RepID=A0ABM9AJE6_9GAMM|nr:RNA 2',3'-cyclic phosphodiesterase [Sinobacterium norvegicum]CAH0993198.1 RNA 2',3'-cyclic phosphodiesterase [Sinobacterium norvegicum]